MLIFAPTTKAQNENKSIQQTISDRINCFETGNIETLYKNAMKCNRHSQNSHPTARMHNQSAQKAADSDQMRIAVSRACSTTSVAKINEFNIDIVRKLYTQPTTHPGHTPPPPPSQPFHLPGDICQTIKNAIKNKAVGFIGDSTDLFIDLVNYNISGVPADLHYIFDQIYTNNIPEPIQHYFSDLYLFCLHKDPNDTTKLRPLGVPTAIRRIIARHIAQVFKVKFAEYLLPYNYAVGIPNGSDTIINSIHLAIEKYITNRQSAGLPPTRAAIFLDLTNMFNSISRKEFLSVIATSFPELLPIIELFYNKPGKVYYKYNDKEWHSLLMEEGSTQGCPLSPILGALVASQLLQPIDKALKLRAAARLAKGNTHDDGHGGITNLLAFIDDISTVVPLEDLLFLCQQFETLGIPLGCFINTKKTRILTSTSGISPIPLIYQHDSALANAITIAITQYSNKRNKQDPQHPTPVELTEGFRLLGIPVGSPTFVTKFINEKLNEIQKQTNTIHSSIHDPQTRYKIFCECTLQKIPHLLLTDVLYNLDTNDSTQPFTSWNGPLVQATNQIVRSFLNNLYNTDLPNHSLLIAQLDISKGGLGCLDTSARAIPDFVLNFTKTRRNATTGIRTHRDLPPRLSHTTLADLYDSSLNPESTILKRFHSLIPNLASIACPPTIPRTELSQYFLDRLSPTSARSRLKKHISHQRLNELYTTVNNDHPKSLHILPSILSTTTSYPLVSMSRSNVSNRIPPIEFQIALRRKLRLPIFPFTHTMQML
jgi:hypothetical protein